MGWLGWAVRWLDLLATAGLIGALAVRVLIVGPSAGRLAPAEGAALARRLARLADAALALLALTTVAGLLVRAQVMADGGIGSAVAAVPAVVARTHFGTVWVIRAAFLVTLVATRSHPRSRLVLAALVGLTASLTGHAAAVGDLRLRVAADWLHLVTASVWAGGLVALALAVLPSPAARVDRLFVAAVAGRFSRLAGACVAAVVASGLYNAWTELPSPAALWTTTYGRVLLVKLAAFAVALALGAANRYVLLPRLAADPTGTGRLAFARLVASEAWLLALVVLACTGLLVQTEPPRHAGREGHHVAPGHQGHGEPAPVMEEGRPERGGAGTSGP